MTARDSGEPPGTGTNPGSGATPGGAVADLGDADPSAAAGCALLVKREELAMLEAYEPPAAAPAPRSNIR